MKRSISAMETSGRAQAGSQTSPPPPTPPVATSAAHRSQTPGRTRPQESTQDSVRAVFNEPAKKLKGGAQLKEPPQQSWPGQDIRFIGPNNRYDLDKNFPKNASPKMQRNHAFAKFAFAEIYKLNASPANRSISPERHAPGVVAGLQRLGQNIQRKQLESVLGDLLKNPRPDGTRRSPIEVTFDAREVAGQMIGAHLLHVSEHTPKPYPIVGNCEEVSDMAFVVISGQDNNPSVEFAVLMRPTGADPNAPKPDHVFLILGREMTTDIQNHTTWNPDAVILDLHAREIYPKDMLKEKMDEIPQFSQGSTRVLTHRRFEDSKPNTMPQRMDHVPTNPGEIATLLVNHGYLHDPRTGDARAASLQS